MKNNFLSHILLFLICAVYAVHSTAQSQSYPQDYFRSPLDIPLFLSGSFGELRSNHFHAGLDIKTEGVEGKKVFAIADGYVSRIKVSPYGYGHALYITHPNGYTSVYGHLKKYSDKIAEIVEQEQYKRESFAVQIFPPPFSLQVKKGEIIAYTGNTGGSGGPHLHFEIRDTKSEHPINPLFFGFDIKDKLNPDIYAVTIYPMNDTSFVNGSNNPQRYRAYGSNGVYRISQQSIFLNGDFGFGIESVDRMNGTGNRLGLHQIKLSLDEELIFEKQMDEFAFHEGRYINAYIDYERYIRSRRRVQRSFVLPGNNLRCYPTLVNNGEIHIDDEQTHEMRYEVQDIYGNTSTISFTIEGIKDKPQTKGSQIGPEKVKFFPYDQKNTFINDEILVSIPKGLLYEDIYFEYRKESNPKTISPVYWIHNHFTPLHSYMNISIKAPNVPDHLKSQALIVSTTNGKYFYAEGGEWKGDNINVKTRSFGGYGIAIDSIKPRITPINIYENALMRNKWSIAVKINDNLSGIDYYRAEVDGNWILMQYDAKNDLLVHYFDDRISPGSHDFKLTVKDGVGNTREFECKFRR